MGKWKYSSTILVVTRWIVVVGFTPQPLYSLGKHPPGTHSIGGWVDPRAGLDTAGKRKIESNLSCPAHSPSLYQPNYQGSSFVLVMGDYLQKAVLFMPYITMGARGSIVG
jgi:hypothetical protein